jgi:hypothetical protein
MTSPARRSIAWPFRRVLRLLALLAVSGALASCASLPPRSADDAPPRFPGPLPPPRPPVPVALTVPTIEAFLVWAQTVPVGQRDVIVQQIAPAAGNDGVVDALTQRLLTFPVMDLGRHLMLLATLGQMRNPRAIDPLIQFVSYPGPMFPPLPEAAQKESTFVSVLDYRAVLQARAAEMLAYIGGRGLAATLDIAGTHPTREVRLAAIDAYLFNENDSEAARAALRRVVPAADAKLIGLPRRTRGMDGKTFDARVRAFYEQHPEEIPPVPADGTRERPHDLPTPRGE